MVGKGLGQIYFNKLPVNVYMYIIWASVARVILLDNLLKLHCIWYSEKYIPLPPLLYSMNLLPIII